MMTSTGIQKGQAFSLAVSAEYRKFLRKMAQAIDFCTENRNQEASVTEAGLAGFERINELFAREQPPQRMPENCGFEAAEKILLTVWAYMVSYPKLTLERFAVYAEANVLLEDMLAGGWFA